MSEENISQKFRSKNIDKTKNYLTEEINWNQLMSNNYKKVCRVLNYIDHLLIIVSTFTGCVSISAFASLVGILLGITSSPIWLKIWATTADTKKYKPIIEKKKKKLDKIVLIVKSKLNIIKVLISKGLIDWIISHDEFVLISSVLKVFYDMKEKI